MYSNCLYLSFSSGMDPNALVMVSSCGVRPRLSISMALSLLDEDDIRSSCTCVYLVGLTMLTLVVKALVFATVR